MNKDEKSKGQILKECIGKSRSLSTLVEYSKDSVVSRYIPVLVKF